MVSISGLDIESAVVEAKAVLAKQEGASPALKLFPVYSVVRRKVIVFESL